MVARALGLFRSHIRRAILLGVLVAAAITPPLFALDRAAAEDGSGLVDSSPPPALEIFKWDPSTNRWITCTITPQHLACRFNGVVPVPVGTNVIVPLDVDVGVECGGGSFSLVGSAQLPQVCSRLSPCVISGFQVSCSASAGQITCDFFRQQDGQWVFAGGATISPSDILDVVVECTGELTKSIRKFLREHVTILPGADVTPSFPVGNSSDPASGFVSLLEFKL